MADDIPREIIVASTNAGKVAELQRMLDDCGVGVRGLVEFGPLEEAAEDGASFAENARQKAQHYGRLSFRSEPFAGISRAPKSGSGPPILDRRNEPEPAITRQEIARPTGCNYGGG